MITDSFGRRSPAVTRREKTTHPQPPASDTEACPHPTTRLFAVPDIVGITVLRRSVRGVEARISRSGRCTVQRTGEVPLPDGVFDGAELVEPSGFAACLEQLWEQGGFKAKRARLVIDGRLAVIRRTELPALGPSQLREAAGYDIGELLNFPIDDAVFDVDEIHRFERNGTTWAKALVVAVEESALTALGTAVSEARLKLSGTDLAAEALVRGVHFDEEFEGPVALIDSEDSATNIVIRDSSGVLFARTLNVGVGETSISVADELESALAQLSSDESQPDELAGSSAAGVPTVVESVRRTLSYYEAELDDRKLQGVIVCGARGQATGLLTSLTDTLGLQAEPGEQVAEWPGGVAIHGYESAIGAALGAAPHKIRHLELTSDRERARQHRRNRRVTIAASAIPTLLFLGANTLGLWTEVSDAQTEADLAAQATETLSLRRSGLGDLESEILTFQGEAATIEAIEEQRVALDMVVRELAASMPADTRLLSIQLERGTANELPPGYSGPTPLGLVTLSGAAADLDAVSRWLAAAEADSTLAGVWLERSTTGPVGTTDDTGTLFSAKAVITAAAAEPPSLIRSDLDGDNG